MNFLKHVGRHGDQKVIIVFRKVPGEDHMCLVVYADRVPRAYHDSIMKVVESKAGQDANDISEVFHRNLLPDGQNMLLTLHKSYLLKKVQTAQIIVTPNTKSSVRLDKLNEMMDEIAAGGTAAKKLQALDENLGMTTQPTKKEIARKAQAEKAQAETWAGLQATGTGVLSDADIANDLRKQSASMTSQANGMLQEAKRLLEEADKLAPAMVAPVATAVVEKKVRKPREKKARKSATA